MKRLPKCKRDAKKINTFSIENDLLAAEQKIAYLNDLELIQMTQSKNLSRIGEYKRLGEILVIYKLRWATKNPRRSDRDGLRVWFCVDEAGERTICPVQSADKNEQSQIQTLDKVRQRLAVGF